MLALASAIDNHTNNEISSFCSFIPAVSDPLPSVSVP
jgi:hypothetical protein